MDTTLPDASGPSRADTDTTGRDTTMSAFKPRPRVVVKVEGMSTSARGYVRNDPAEPR
jgi:hypothetical protein